MGDIGRLLIICGGVLIVLGLLLTFAGKLPWFGKLPGDLVYKSDQVTVYVPLMTCLVISAILSLLLWLLRR